MYKSNQDEAFQSTLYQGASNINQEIREGEAQSINLASIIIEENKTIIYDASSFKILTPEGCIF